MAEINVTSFEIENKCPNCGNDIETYTISMHEIPQPKEEVELEVKRVVNMFLNKV